MLPTGARCEARNLSGRTLEWYDDRTRRFVDWCAAHGLCRLNRLQHRHPDHPDLRLRSPIRTAFRDLATRRRLILLISF